MIRRVVYVDVLAAYAAIEAWVRGRRVLVLGASAAEGAPGLVAAGAARVVAVAAGPSNDRGEASRVEWWTEQDAQTAQAMFDVVVWLDGFGEQPPVERKRALRWLRRLLAADGVLVMRIRAHGDRVDFWSFESELSAAFGDVALLAQVPWEGYSVTPVLDADEAAPELDLVESLLAEDPEPEHYVAVAAPEELPAHVSLQCILVPVPPRAAPSGAADGASLAAALTEATAALEAERNAAAEVRARLATVEFDLGRARTRAEAAEQTIARLERALAEREEEGKGLERRLEELEGRLRELTDERARLSEELARKQDALERARTDVAVARRSVAEHERAVSRLSEALDAKTRELAEVRRALEATDVEARRAVAERDELRRQLDVAVAEREGTRQLAERAEAEVELLRRRLAEQAEMLAAKIEEASRAQGEVAALRERLADDRRERVAARDAEASGGEHGRLLAEIAHDRDRLREELARRNREIANLEERLWAARDDAQRGQLEAARLVAQLEALKERVAWTERAEAERSQEVAQLSAELRKAEVARAELAATLRAREEALAKTPPPAAGEGEAQPLRAQLGELERTLRERSEALTRLRAERAELLDRLASVEARGRAAAARAEELERELSAKTALVAQLKEALEVAKAERTSAEARAKTAEDELAGLRRALAAAEAERDALQGRLESAAVERAALERKVAHLEQGAARSFTGPEAQANLPGDVARYAKMPVDPSWPADAQAAVAALQAAVARGIEAEAISGDLPPRVDRELRYRLAEQEQMLARLEAAEQRIWEMSDAADRHAARLAASLAQLEQTKEQLDEAREELQLNRAMLAAAQARIVEQERLLGSERAKLARAGIGPEGFPLDSGEHPRVEEVFADLDRSMRGPKAPAESGVPETIVADRSSLPSTPGSAPAAHAQGGVVVEALDDAWDDDGVGPDGG
ncbi:MAG: hypothetical protein D6705_02185 [Deltaproteobacteria bacterium]|nr:MAG: hypothetical protein D6705_02185 [Deltaproteobacteria bacterium]